MNLGEERRYPDRMRLAGGIVLSLSACYAPTVPAGAPCDPVRDNCPAGQRCEAGASGSFCRAVPAATDAPTPSGDARLDAPPGCYGSGLVRNLCLVPPPAGDLAITADRVVNTAMVGNGHCDEIVAQSGGPSLCLVAARSITVRAGAQLAGIGPNPLVLVAADTLVVDGTIDVASHATGAAGAGAATTCGDGNTGGNGGNQDAAGGGGAGGSFGTPGGQGGNGRNGSSTMGGAGGQALAAVTPTAVQGGCPGGRGGSGGGGGGSGEGGAGGGAVYLIAGTALSISGVVNASGAGGGEGTDGANSSGGAGGGGSGGMIGLDAPTISVTGSVFANGGGGGGGGGDQPSRHGMPGDDPIAAVLPAPGGSGGLGGGGMGGSGFAIGAAATSGGNGANLYCGGGGGGGGAGIIRVFGVSPSSLGGTFLPPAT